MDMSHPTMPGDSGLPPSRSFGAILIEAGRLSKLHAGRILSLQAQEDIRFGEAGRRLGFLNNEDIRFALARQFEFDCLPPGDVSVSPDVMAAFGSRHPLIEGLRDLRSRISLHWQRSEAGCRSLALVSARCGEGKSFIAANLAVLFSQLGERTLLIDANLIQPSQHELFRLKNRAGLSSILSGLGGLETAVAMQQLGGLSVLPAGPMPPNPRELLSRRMLSKVMAEAAAAFDIVVIDTPAAGLAADAQAIAAHAESSVLVSRPNTATLAETAMLTSNLGNLLGAVVNEF